MLVYVDKVFFVPVHRITETIKLLTGIELLDIFRCNALNESILVIQYKPDPFIVIEEILLKKRDYLC